MDNNTKSIKLLTLLLVVLNLTLAVLIVSHLVESRKRIEIEENFLSNTKNFLEWYKEGMELADANEKLVKHLVAFSGVSKEAAEVGIVISDQEFKSRLMIDPIIDKVLEAAKVADELKTSSKNKLNKKLTD